MQDTSDFELNLGLLSHQIGEFISKHEYELDEKAMDSFNMQDENETNFDRLSNVSPQILTFLFEDNFYLDNLVNEFWRENCAFLKKKLPILKKYKSTVERFLAIRKCSDEL